MEKHGLRLPEKEECMKICPKCQMGNKDDAMYCKDCGISLSRISIKNIEEQLKKEKARVERKEQRTKQLLCMLVAAFGVLDLVILGFSIFHGTMTFIMLIHLLTLPAGYAAILHPDALFHLNHSKDIENIHDVEPSEWYYYKCKAAGISVMALGTISMLILAFA
jgi:hypothetical protein